MNKVSYRRYRAINSKQRLTSFLALIVILLFDSGYMKWGNRFLLISLSVLLLSVVLYFIIRRSIFLYRKKILENREIIARWVYEDAYWNEYSAEEDKRSGKIPWGGITLGLICILLGVLFYFVNKNRTIAMLIAFVGAGVVIVVLFWVYSLIRRALFFRNPGDVIVARGGVYFKGTTLFWNGKSCIYDSIYVENRDGRSLMVLHYRTKKPDGQVFVKDLEIPVPSEFQQDAIDASRNLNSKPYWNRAAAI